MSGRGLVRVGVVGIGFGQHVQVPAFLRDERVRVEGICASSDERAQAVARRLGLPRAWGDWRDMVADPHLDAISLAVPPAHQAEIALAALQAGKHLFAEKPLGMSVTEAAVLEATARQRGLVGAIDFEFRAVAAWQEARALLERGAIGRVRGAHVSWRIETQANRDPKPSWKREGDAGGGTLNLFLSHTLDGVLWLLGPVRRLTARLWPPTGADARADLWLELIDGVAVTISAAADAPGGSGHRLELLGDEGALLLENASSDYMNGFTLTLRRRQAPPTIIDLPAPAPGEDGRIAAVSVLVRRFVDAVLGGPPMVPGLVEGLAVQRLVDAARVASSAGTWQRID